MYYHILSACDSILATYFELFFWTTHLLSLVLNGIKHALGMKYTKVQNTTEEQIV